jgi:hypothetical protein
MTDKTYTFADLRTIVPAATPAWIRVIEVYEVERDDNSKTKEWSDLVFPVLAYATLPDGEGAFLIYHDEGTYASGPTWATRFTPETAYTDSEVRIELSIGTPPAKGEPCVFTLGAVYDPDPCSMSDFCLWWIL